MDEVLRSLQLLRESFLRFFGQEQIPPAGWFWAILGCCIFLLLCLSSRFVVRKRMTRRLRSGPSSSSGEEEVRHALAPATESVMTLPADAFCDENDPGERFHPLPMGEEGEESLLARLRGKLAKTHEQLIGRMDKVLLRTGASKQEFLEALEEVLLTADLGVKTTHVLLEEVRRELESKGLHATDLKSALRKQIRSMLDIQAPAFRTDSVRPFVIMVAGVNGVGKTTSIGKLAAYLKGPDQKVMLVAADTFRAAAIEQLQIWADRVGTDFVKHKPESDPSAVVYDAMQAAKSRKTDLVIVDTAGRLHTKTNLMEELKKVKRIMTREMEGAPHEVLLVVDATTGQNAIHQARTFHDALGVTGLVLTKLDGTAKGGVIVGIAHELHLPVRFIGVGERLEDLREFNPDLFLEAIFTEPEGHWVH